MKLSKSFSVIVAALIVASAAPALANDGTFSIDIGGKNATNTVNPPSAS